MRVPPQSSYQCETEFPDNHLPGTHWIHHHVYGSSTVEVDGGAAMTLIVRDPDSEHLISGDNTHIMNQATTFPYLAMKSERNNPSDSSF